MKLLYCYREEDCMHGRVSCPLGRSSLYQCDKPLIKGTVPMVTLLLIPPMASMCHL